MDTTPPTVADVFRDAPALVRCHLSVDDPLAMEAATLDALIEATFAGYLPKLADHWSALVPGSSPLSVSREMSAAYQCIEDGADAMIRGWFCAADLSPGVPVLIAAGSVDPTVNMNVAGRVCAVRAHITIVPEEDASGLRLLIRSVALAYIGGIDQMALHGEDRRALQELKKALTRIARRDAEIPSLTTRSKRSRVAVVPADDSSLVGAAETLTSRVNTLLAG